MNLGYGTQFIARYLFRYNRSVALCSHRSLGAIGLRHSIRNKPRASHIKTISTGL
jgi:hypothetical protein